MIELSQIKLVIWDLDETFWKGTLSEEGAFQIQDNISLVKDLTDRGIVNSICSKNDEGEALEELDKMGIKEYFVFPDINWNPKGERVKNLIARMKLRPHNVLFLDDNPVNRNEVLFYNENIKVGFTDEIRSLIEQCKNTVSTDISHKRLKQYKVLEAKIADQESFPSNEDFLNASNIKVSIKHDCKNVFDRIYELIQRTNQLNYTKIRCDQQELNELLNDDHVEKGYIQVSDKYGDYGIVGFYALKENRLIHFLFSCRTIGQGIEQYVYAQLNYPKLSVSGEVISIVDNSPSPNWINQPDEVTDSNEMGIPKSSISQKPKILFKGPCDMLMITNYLEDTNIIDKEFEYVGDKGNVIRQNNHSTQIVQSACLTNSEKQIVLNECIFADEHMFDTKIFDGSHDVIFLSSMREPHLGVYRKKGSNLRVVFGLATSPLTEESNWDLYVNKSPNVDRQQNIFTYDYLKEFSQKYEFLGRITAEEYKKNLEYILSHIGQSVLCVLLASEIPHPNPVAGYDNRDMFHREYNAMLRKLSKQHKNLILLDVNKYVKSSDDYTNTINHYKRYIYFKLANEVRDIINRYSSARIEKKSLLQRQLLSIINCQFGSKMLKRLSKHNFFYSKLKSIYHIIAKI